MTKPEPSRNRNIADAPVRPELKLSLGVASKLATDAPATAR